MFLTITDDLDLYAGLTVLIVTFAACAVAVFLLGKSSGIAKMTVQIRRGCMSNSLHLSDLAPGLYSSFFRFHGTTLKIRFTMVERHYTRYLEREFTVDRFYCVKQFETDQELPAQFEVTEDLQIREVDINRITPVQLS